MGVRCGSVQVGRQNDTPLEICRGAVRQPNPVTEPLPPKADFHQLTNQCSRPLPCTSPSRRRRLVPGLLLSCKILCIGRMAVVLTIPPLRLHHLAEHAEHGANLTANSFGQTSTIHLLYKFRLPHSLNSHHCSISTATYGTLLSCSYLYSVGSAITELCAPVLF